MVVKNANAAYHRLPNVGRTFLSIEQEYGASTMTTLHLSENEQAVMDLIRFQGPMSVAELCEALGITATAVRQRLIRLTSGELLERIVVRRERGRPVHLYRLTKHGREAAGDNLADLAEALWMEVIAIDDAGTRSSVIEGVLRRLTEKYSSQIAGQTVTERLRAIATLFRQRKIPFVVDSDGGQATLRISGCPYPQLSEHGMEICQLEQQLVERLLDGPVALSHCTCDSSGGQCCTFSADALKQLNEFRPAAHAHTD
jgi:predicted ArsR family transcriptional regulator